MRYFYDTEFIDDGRTIELISIGVAAEDGREYYAISTEFNPDRAGRWVRKHVLPKLPSPSSKLWRSRRQIRSELEDFFDIDGDEPIELWAWVGAYDHVVLCQLWGPMTDLPPAMPRFTASCASSGRNGGRRACRRDRPMRTTRWSMRGTICTGSS
ncbi:Gp101 [Mycolicibacterium fortuitum]|uniref:Gp101 n=1 Tax=Mycolicibacterium fortuitum TaxID=1766 RepID=A0A378UDC2_MYCFO|nr:Gp101 [Mycolicibacterium fortuitum]